MKPIILKFWDNYNKQEIELVLGTEDKLHVEWSSSGSDGIRYHSYLLFRATKGDKDSCDPQRWSDLQLINTNNN